MIKMVITTMVKLMGIKIMMIKQARRFINPTVATNTAKARVVMWGRAKTCGRKSSAKVSEAGGASKVGGGQATPRN